jgi:hypothetical protein
MSSSGKIALGIGIPGTIATIFAAYYTYLTVKRMRATAREGGRRGSTEEGQTTHYYISSTNHNCFQSDSEIKLRTQPRF